MNIKELQERVDSWIKAYGVRYFDIKTNALLLVEETGELLRHIARNYGEQSYKNPKDVEKAHTYIKDEIGDIIFVLTCLANQMDIDLQEVIQQNLDKKTKRDKFRHTGNTKLKN